MKDFIDKYKNYLKKYLKENYDFIKLYFTDLDKIKEFNYEEKESPLHNSVEFLNKKFMKEVEFESNLLEIGCGSKSSIITANNKFLIRKDALDVQEINSKGEKTLANIIGTVSKLPFRSNSYDFCISNQSIEHWFEYNVSISQGIYEISRVLKINSGSLIINFPLFLHGKREFVQGNLEFIISEISKYLKIYSLEIVYASNKKYKGWVKCNQTESRVTNFIKKKDIDTIPFSIVCEIKAQKEKDFYSKDRQRQSFLKRKLNILRDYTLLEIISKLLNSKKK